MARGLCGGHDIEQGVFAVHVASPSEERRERECGGSEVMWRATHWRWKQPGLDEGPYFGPRLGARLARDIYRMQAAVGQRQRCQGAGHATTMYQKQIKVS